ILTPCPAGRPEPGEAPGRKRATPGRVSRRGSMRNGEKGGLQLHDARGLEPFRPLGHVELDLLTLGEGLEAFPLDGGVVDEHVLPVLLLDEPVALGVTEPLHPARLAHRLRSLPRHGQWTQRSEKRRDYKERRFRVSRKMRWRTGARSE